MSGAVITTAGSERLARVRFCDVSAARPSDFGDEWYTISGYRLSTKPTARGIYLHQGKKVVIR